MQSPGEFIRIELETRGWTQTDLAAILDRPLPTINRILKGKHAVLPDMAIALGQAFATGPEIWMHRESEYRLSLATPPNDTNVIRRAKAHSLAPIKELEKRGWIKRSTTIDDLEHELKHFYCLESIDSLPAIGVATRRSGHQEKLTPSQNAWCFRVWHLASNLQAGKFEESKMDECIQKLRKIAAYPKETHKVSRLLSEFGIRLVIVEPLSGCKVDGVAMWLDNQSPIIGMSIRYDRFDNFWFTLCHELSHIIHRDDASVDLDSGGVVTEVKPPIEVRADSEAAAMLVPKEELDSFIRRVGPLYSSDRIVQFAHRIKIHPAIIVGQLQNCGEIGYSSHREMLSKVRQIVTPATLCDGWGHSVNDRNGK